MHSVPFCNTYMQVHAYKEVMMMITGAELIVKALKTEQVGTLYAYPGGGTGY